MLTHYQRVKSLLPLPLPPFLQPFYYERFGLRRYHDVAVCAAYFVHRMIKREYHTLVT